VTNTEPDSSTLDALDTVTLPLPSPPTGDADDPSIALMIQIYLQSECIDAPGTSFHLEKIYNMQLIRNHGYFNFNTDAKQHESYTLPNGARRSFAMSMSLIN
jgi:hypothetical protein